MFISFEGIEGSGKSTQVRLLQQALEARGRQVVTTREPGGSRLGQELRRILLSAANSDLSATAELFLFLADRAQHVAEVIRPALAAGKVVLCDRFADSTVAYQGYGRGLDAALLEQLNRAACGALAMTAGPASEAAEAAWPALTILLDLEPEAGLRRAMTRNAAAGTCAAEGRFEAESLAFHQRIRQGFLALAAAEPGRFVVLDAAAEPQAVHGRVLDAVLARLA